jgi:DmsE family decaheme c-type cytochrome
VCLLVPAACGLLSRDVRTPDVVLSRAPDAKPIGSTGCLACHDASQADLSGTVHAGLDLAGMCESCHGPGSVHQESYEAAHILGGEALQSVTNAERSGMCLSCHETMASSWSRSPHDVREVSCWTCHPDAIHSGVEVEDPVEPPQPGGLPDGGRFCFQCHFEVEQEFLLQVRHPVTGGSMSCTDCHGPHGEEGTVETAVDVTDLCTGCHVEVAGPWIYEHDAMFEGCTSCHEPHGSPNPKLLAQTGNGLCLQCHVDALHPIVGGAGHASYMGAGATCWQCHFEVHGSNTSEMLAPGM